MDVTDKKQGRAKMVEEANSVRISATLACMLALLLAAPLALLTLAPAQAGEPPREAGWQQHAMPIPDGTGILAMAANRERSTIAVLYAERGTENTELKLIAFNGTGNQTKSVDLGSQMRVAGQLNISLRAGLSVDDNGVGYVALAGNGVVFARVDLRRAVAPRIKVIRMGGSYGDISTLRYTHQGRLMLAGKLDRYGFIASISPQGDLDWIKSYDKVATVFDLVESDGDFVLAGCTPGNMACQDIWLARIDAAGEVLESRLEYGPSRYAYLAEDGRRLALSFERLDPDLEAGTALLEVFPSGASLRESTSHVLYKGRLAAPFSLSGDAGGFTAAGAVERGGLRIFVVGADGRLSMLFKGQTQPPYYVSFGYLEVIRAPGSNYLGGVRTHAEGRRAETRLVFARIPAK